MSVATYSAIIRNGKIEPTTALELPEGSEVYVVVPSVITARVAKRKANGWLISEVGNLLMADHGILAQTDQGWIWRYGVYMTSLTHEPWGPIGEVIVSATSGEIMDPEQTKMDLLYHRARGPVVTRM
ncbi:MAG: hypothetical protein R3C14_46220 [Caldilineaceae bacterium]